MRSFTFSALFTTAALAYPRQGQTESVASSTTCNGQQYTYDELAGYGFIPSNARDKYGDTIGGIGSSASIEYNSWKILPNGTYTGTLWALPDRGWNTQGTLNYENRVHKIQVNFNPAATGAPNLQLFYQDTIKFTDPSGTPLTGLDADAHGPYLNFPGYPVLPAATYAGNGFGGNGTGGHRVVLDSEGLVLNADGSFWVSEEYGPYIYRFDSAGQMIEAIRPPEPYIPIRNGSDSFSADSPPIYDPTLTVIPENNPTGRDNNQGFEGLTASPDGTSLYALVQSALNQDGGLQGGAHRRYTRLLHYDITVSPPSVVGEYVVPLPLYTDHSNKTKVAAQSEIHYISDTQFLILARDSNSGHGQKNSESIYRHADVFDISSATNIYGEFTVAPNGTLYSNITAAEYCPFLDYNNNTQLARFDLHNGGAQNATLLNEKWESFALAPVLSDGGGWSAWGPQKGSNQYYLFSLSDNDFITQDGYLNGGQFQYADASGYNLDNQFLVFKVTLPQGSNPLVAR